MILENDFCKIELSQNVLYCFIYLFLLRSPPV